jgi:hypothetical protein
VRFNYTRGPGAENCPTEEAMRLRLNSEFRYDPIKPNAGPLIEIAVTRVSGRFHAEIKVSDAKGNVVWANKMEKKTSCAALMDDAAYDAYFGAIWKLPQEEEASPPPKEPAPAPPPAPAPAPAAPTAAPPVRPPIRPAITAMPAPTSAVHAGAGPVVNFGLAPGTSLGGLGFFTWYWRDFLSITAEARVTGSVVPSYADEHPPLRGLFVGGAGVPCYHRAFLFGCIAFDLGLLQGSADGDRLVETKSPVVFGIGLRPGFERTFANRFTVRGFGELTGIVTKSTIALNRLDVWTTPRACASVGLSLTMPLY